MFLKNEKYLSNHLSSLAKLPFENEGLNFEQFRFTFFSKKDLLKDYSFKVSKDE